VNVLVLFFEFPRGLLRKRLRPTVGINVGTFRRVREMFLRPSVVGRLILGLLVANRHGTARDHDTLDFIL